MIIKTFGEVCDELTILELKKKFLNDEFTPEHQTRLDLLVQEVDYQKQRMTTSKAYITECINNLQEANRAIWYLEYDLRSMKVERWFEADELYTEIGKRAESIRKINNDRIKWKNELNKIVKDIMELKGQHLSQ